MARTKKSNSSSANLGFEEKLWAAADKLRGHMDAAEYKHVVLGIIFIKYISDAFAELHDKLKTDGDDPEDRDYFTAENVFWVPKEARWAKLQRAAKLPTIGKLIDDAMVAIEKENPVLKGVLPKEYAKPSLDKTRLGELIDLIGTIGLGDADSRKQDILGRVYEYFLGKFASAEGKGGGEFYTPQSVVRLLVEMIEPYKGCIYDPCCGSGGMFVQSEKFVLAHGGRIGDLSIYGQESNNTTWRLCKMNLAIRGIEGNIGPHNADTFHHDVHKDLRADFILANPPFNISDLGGDRLKEDVRWKYGTPPTGNANFGWVLHMVHRLAPGGVAGFVLANGSMSSSQSGEDDIRRQLIEADLVDYMIALPGQLFSTTQIPVCLWFLTHSKSAKPFRDHKSEKLFIDARKLGTLIDRTHRELTESEILHIAQTYHSWRGSGGTTTIGDAKREGTVGTISTDKTKSLRKHITEAAYQNYADVAGFCKSATTKEIESHGFVLTPGRYVRAEDIEDDGEPFAETMQLLTAKVQEQFKERAKLEKAILNNLQGLGYGK